MDINNKRTRVYGYIIKGYNYDFIMEEFNCSLIFVLNTCRLVIQSKGNNIGNATRMHQIITIAYPKEEVPEVWI